MTAADRTLALDVQILGRSYKVACKENERAALLDAVTMLDDRMRAIQESNKTIGIDRIAVIAALNIANELMQVRHERDDAQRDASALPEETLKIQHRLRELHQSIDRVLADPDKSL